MLDVAYVSSASSTRLHHLFNVALLFVLRRLENDLTKPLNLIVSFSRSLATR